MTKPKSCWHSTVRFIFSGCVEEGGLLPLPLVMNPWLVKLVSFILPAVQASIIVNHRQ